ncbi:MAG: hypothetical protein H7066_11375 [Cytophagaceae bacterium]|nr:hypothetical protein [Gemmatimonadaceae bacterium]
MRFVRLIDALAMTLLFAATIAGAVGLVSNTTRPVGPGQWSVQGAQLAYCLLSLLVMWGWRKRRGWIGPVAWAWAVTFTWAGAAASKFYGNAPWSAVGAAFLAGGIIAAVTVWWITQRNLLAPLPPTRTP